MRPLLLSLLLGLNLVAATWNSDGSQADTQSKINSAADGDTVLLADGAFTWTSGVTVSGKGIHIMGGGSGRIIARSTSTVTLGTGTKTWTLNASGLNISNGQTLTIWRTGGKFLGGGISNREDAWMKGTVNSYSGTSLEMNITSTSSTGSGTHSLWIVGTEPTTSITHNAGTGNLFELTEDTTHHVEISDMTFICGTGTGFSVYFSPTSGGKIIKAHDCMTQTAGGGGWFISMNRGLIWNCSFHDPNNSVAPLAIDIVCNGETTSWTTTSTWGDDDTDGLLQLYVEDCDFHAYLNAVDNSMNARSVFRHCLFNNAGFGSHGADTGNWGSRYFECYDTEFLFNGYGDTQTLPMNWIFLVRGGSFTVTDCIIPNVTSTDYGNKTEFVLAVYNLSENAGPNPCWSANTAPIDYPCPRQVGMGYVTGLAGNDSITYIGDSEPCYAWNNTGTFTFDTGSGDLQCTNPDSASDYIVVNRDYYTSTARPSYTKFEYPHPLRGEGTGETSGAGKGRGQKGSGGRGRLR